LNASIGVISGGQFQKALIAFALLGEPSVLLFDEPTASLDELAEERVYELVERLQQEQHLTVLLVSHDLSIVYRAANKVLCVSKDKVCFGPPREVLTLQHLKRCTLHRRSSSYTGMVKSRSSNLRRLSMSEPGTVYSIILAFLFAVAAGLVGSFALMKRMILAADVISHVALPGLGLAFLWHFNPLLGGGATLFLGHC